MSNIGMINYSIIIPHKNTPELLQYCLDSIPVRDDVQVIVVDDNSDVNIVDFEHFPQWEGKDYEVYPTKEGKGAGYARNIGLEHARGKWILFVDADDFLLSSMGEVFDAEKDTDADIVFFRPKAVMLNDRKAPSKRADFYNRMIDSFFDNGVDIELRCRWFSPCSKLYKLTLIKRNEICFDEIRYSNDNLFSVKTGVCAGKIEARNQTYLCITESNHSLTSNFMKKPCELRIRTDAFFRAQKVVHDHGFPVDEELSLKYLKKLFSEDREAFLLNYDRMRKMGYKRKWLTHELFKSHRLMSRIKRTAYVMIKTGF